MDCFNPVKHGSQYNPGAMSVCHEHREHSCNVIHEAQKINNLTAESDKGNPTLVTLELKSNLFQHHHDTHSAMLVQAS